LGLSNNNASQYRVYEIKDVLSKYKYEDGYRTYQHGSYSTKPNRWAKFNDYADTYSWVYLNDINQEVNFDTPLALLNYLSVYPSRQRLWMWHDWVLHFSSNWLSLKNAKGEQGLPPYVGERYVKRIASSSQASSFNDYLRDHVFVSTNPARNIGSWQAGLPLVSYTDYYGYRNRTNPKCIYQLSEVFDNQHGAFSGNPTLPETFSAPDYEDDEKEEQDFYYDLSNGRIMITTDTHYSPIKVYQYNPSPASSARTLIATSNTSAARIAAGEGILDVKVAPNPISNDVIMIKLSHEVRGDVEFQLFDLAGKEVFSRKQKSMGESEFTLKLSHPLPSGTYLLKMIINQEVYTEKVLSL
ncbi:MAG: T9SS type A sorting domain-containing protein, partial [Runella zeae]